MAAAVAVVGVMSALQKGAAEASAAEFNAQVAKNNAWAAKNQSDFEARKQRVMARKQLGGMRANYAASGVSMDGSALDVLEESAASAEMDNLTIKHGGDVKYAGFQNDAALSDSRADGARTGAALGAASSMLNAYGSSVNK